MVKTTSKTKGEEKTGELEEKFRKIIYKGDRNTRSCNKNT